MMNQLCFSCSTLCLGAEDLLTSRRLFCSLSPFHHRSRYLSSENTVHSVFLLTACMQPFLHPLTQSCRLLLGYTAQSLAVCYRSNFALTVVLHDHSREYRYSRLIVSFQLVCLRSVWCLCLLSDVRQPRCRSFQGQTRQVPSSSACSLNVQFELTSLPLGILSFRMRREEAAMQRLNNMLVILVCVYVCACECV